MTTGTNTPTAQDVVEAMEDLTRLYELREEYAGKKEELSNMERSMHKMFIKVWSTLDALAKDKATKEREKGA